MMSSTSSSSSSNLTDGTSVVRNKILDNMLRSHLSFKNTNPFIPQQYIKSDTIKRRAKFASSFQVRNTDNPTLANPSQTTESRLMLGNASMESSRGDSNALVTSPTDTRFNERGSKADAQARLGSSTSVALQTNANKILTKVPQPKWHSPWELSAVVAGHLGWVRSIAFDPSNEWFATGSSDRTIKIWDLAKCCAGVEGGLKLTLTGHLNAIRGLAVSSRHPYLFSVSEDKQVNCWDLEYNKIIRHYHGHLSAVFCVTMHPTLDLLITGGRDSVARVWDIRTKHQIHVLAGHTDAVSNVLAYSVDPQIVTASHDSTVKLWDLAAGRAMSTLTQHKKAVRGLCASPTEMSFASASADNIKKWQTRDGRFLKNFTGHNSVVNCLAANEDGVMVSGGDNGSLQFWDYESGYSFQSTKTIVQPGSLDAEAGIFAMVFDLSGSRLLTCEADKTIKIWRENPDASEDSHPIDMKTWTKQCLQLKRY